MTGVGKPRKAQEASQATKPKKGPQPGGGVVETMPPLEVGMFVFKKTMGMGMGMQGQFSKP